MRATIGTLFLCMLLIGALPPKAHAQNTARNWSLNVAGGVNMWVSDYNKMKFGPGGEVGVRYNFSRIFSLGLYAGFQELKTFQDPPISTITNRYLKLNAYPVSARMYVRFFPTKLVAPYVYVGGGMMMYQRQTSNQVYVPDNKWRASYIVPVGVGIESFVSRKLSITVDAGFTNFGDWIDQRKNNTLDGMATGSLGLAYYFGSSDDDDDDHDGLTNGEERRYGTNPKVADTDGDGLSDGEEVKRYRTNPLRADTDGDGLSDGDEVFKYHTDPTKFDTDGDGLSDGDEVLKYHTDPLKVDTDGDGLSDGDEVLLYHTDPLKVDTDGDGLSDWDEGKTYKTDPLNPDTDGDGLTDGDEVKRYRSNPLIADTDGGGVNDGEEVRRGTDPLDPRDDFPGGRIILEKGKTVILEGVQFATGSAVLTGESESTLQKALKALQDSPDIRIEIAGYTDNVGKPATNTRLSLKRANSVSAWLVSHGVNASRITVAGKGSADPIAPNTSAEGRAKNRRIEFHVVP